jgi:HAD superfamily hydrolase (TIGR01484 family)
VEQKIHSRKCGEAKFSKRKHVSIFFCKQVKEALADTLPVIPKLFKDSCLSHMYYYRRMQYHIKLVVSDIDGTLAPHARHDVSDVVREAIIAVENKGIVVAAVSGRPYAMAKQTLNVLGISGLCVLDGGATIVDTRTDENIWRQWLSIAKVKEILTLILPYCTEIIYTEGDNIVEVAGIDIDFVDAETPSIFPLVDSARESELKAILDTIQGIDYYFLDSVHPRTLQSHRAVQITHHEATKQHGVEALRGILHIPIENTLAIGDGDNDIALFRSAVLKIAMGNGTDALKAKADYITGSLEDDGFAQAMYEYIL